MQPADILLEALDRVTATVQETVTGLDAAALLWRPDPEANPIGWLVWHLARIRDDHVCGIAGWDQTWTLEGWAPRFGLPVDDEHIGYEHTTEQVDALVPPDAETLLGYHDRVAHRTRGYVESLTGDDLDRVVDTSFAPVVTAGVRLVSVVDDGLQHAGQAAYLRGLWERRA